MKLTRAWLIIRTDKESSYPPHVVGVDEVEKIVKADIGDHPRTVGRGSVLFLRGGGLAYSHASPVEIAEEFGWR